MELIFKIVTYLIAVVMLAIIHLAGTYLLPEPFVRINIIFAALTVFMLLKERGGVVWLSFVLHLFLELYATTPFGIVLFSGTVSILFSYWVYQSVFTNRSWYAAMAIVSLALLLYRGCYIVLLLFAQVLFGTVDVVIAPLVVSSLGELLWTTLLVGIIMLFLTRRLKRFNTKVIYS